MKRLLPLLFSSISLIPGYTQQASIESGLQKLSMADAIIKGRGQLAPASLKQLQWVPQSDLFSYVDLDKVIVVHASTLERDTLDLLKTIQPGIEKSGGKKLTNLPPITWISKDQFWFQSDHVIYKAHLDGTVSVKNWYPKEAENTDIEPNDFKTAYTLNDNLFINIGGKELGVGISDKKGLVFGKSVHRDEFGISKGTYWSPNGRFLAYYQMDESMVTEYPIIILDSMPAQIRTIRYPFSGSKSHEVTIGVYDTQSGKSVLLKTGEPKEQYLTNIAWTPDEKFILVAIVNREQNRMSLKMFDAQTGEIEKILFEETNDRWVEPENPPIFVPGKSDWFIWQSERQGFKQLYLYSLTGKLIRHLTPDKVPVTNTYGFSENASDFFYQAADESGLNRYLYRVNLYTGKSSRMTKAEGTHQIIPEKGGRWFIDVFSNNNTPRSLFVQSTQPDSQPTTLFTAPNPLTKVLLGQTKLLSLNTTDGYALNTRLIFPPDFDIKKRYPTILYVYNGPHVQLVTNTWLCGAELWMHRLACNGYIVAVVDGRGSANRGFAFESAIHRNLATLEIQDQLAVVKYLIDMGFADSDRIGVYGWSYGGFMTTSLLTRPESTDVFKCGVAGGPVLDWSMYEIMYTERYMDTPKENPEGYAKNNLFNYIENLNRRLLLIHGSSDDIVLWQHSLRYIRECVRKNKQVEYFVYPEHPHNVGGKDRVHLFEKIEQFFLENL
jgi:dipeptidyl-peptidase-4